MYPIFLYHITPRKLKTSFWVSWSNSEYINLIKIYLATLVAKIYTAFSRYQLEEDKVCGP